MKNINEKKFVFITTIMIFILLITFSLVSGNNNSDNRYIVNIYFFWGDGCPHCAEEEPFLESLINEFGSDTIVLHKFELWYHPENEPIAENFAKAFNFSLSGVPTTFIGNNYWVGFSETTKEAIDKAVRDGVTNGVVDAQDIVDGKQNLVPPEKEIESKISAPIFGEIDLKDKSILLTTIIIGLVDGINPCSLWVLTMLLAMVLHTNSRKKTLIIGVIFLFVTSAIYILFILGVFTALTYVSYMQWIQRIIAAITLIMGLINLKDYFFFKKGVSLTIDDEKKPGLYQKMRNVMNASENFWAMCGATIVLAAGVSLIEFSCTAAFPVVWSNLLIYHHVGKLTFAVMLLLYMFLYQLDENVIFILAVITMKSSRIEEKHGRILKLFSGLLMVVLSLVMLINPAVMNNLAGTLFVFLIATLITVFIFLITDKLLPKYGIYIGHKESEKKSDTDNTIKKK